MMNGLFGKNAMVGYLTGGVRDFSNGFLDTFMSTDALGREMAGIFGTGEAKGFTGFLAGAASEATRYGLTGEASINVLSTSVLSYLSGGDPESGWNKFSNGTGLLELSFGKDGFKGKIGTGGFDRSFKALADAAQGFGSFANHASWKLKDPGFLNAINDLSLTTDHKMALEYYNRTRSLQRGSLDGAYGQYNSNGVTVTDALSGNTAEEAAMLASILSHEGTHADGNRLEGVAHAHGLAAYQTILAARGLEGSSSFRDEMINAMTLPSSWQENTGDTDYWEKTVVNGKVRYYDDNIPEVWERVPGGRRILRRANPGETKYDTLGSLYQQWDWVVENKLATESQIDPTSGDTRSFITEDQLGDFPVWKQLREIGYGLSVGFSIAGQEAQKVPSDFARGMVLAGEGFARIPGDFASGVEMAVENNPAGGIVLANPLAAIAYLADSAVDGDGNGVVAATVGLATSAFSFWKAFKVASTVGSTSSAIATSNWLKGVGRDGALGFFAGYGVGFADAYFNNENILDLDIQRELLTNATVSGLFNAGRQGLYNGIAKPIPSLGRPSFDYSAFFVSGVSATAANWLITPLYDPLLKNKPASWNPNALPSQLLWSGIASVTAGGFISNTNSSVMNDYIWPSFENLINERASREPASVSTPLRTPPQVVRPVPSGRTFPTSYPTWEERQRASEGSRRKISW